MKNKPDFATAVSMICTESQFRQDLEKPLRALGYVFDSMTLSWGVFIIVTNANRKKGHVSDYKTSWQIQKLYGRFFIEVYNPEKFLALAAMTNGPFPIPGEMMIHKITGNLEKINFINTKTKQVSCLGVDYADLSLYRKPDLFEIVCHFDNPDEVNAKQAQINKNLNQKNMENTTDKFDSWAIVELFGHTKIAGLASTKNFGNTVMLQVNVPDTATQPAFTRLFGMNSIYSLSPVTEEVARTSAEVFKSHPITDYNVQIHFDKVFKQKVDEKVTNILSECSPADLQSSENDEIF